MYESIAGRNVTSNTTSQFQWFICKTDNSQKTQQRVVNAHFLDYFVWLNISIDINVKIEFNYSEYQLALQDRQKPNNKTIKHKKKVDTKIQQWIIWE